MFSRPLTPREKLDLQRETGCAPATIHKAEHGLELREASVLRLRRGAETLGLPLSDHEARP